MTIKRVYLKNIESPDESCFSFEFSVSSTTKTGRHNVGTMLSGLTEDMKLIIELMVKKMSW
jgi:hypothetical protein